MRAEPWPWIVAGTLAATIAVSLGFAYTAISNPDPLVVDDVYAEGLVWNQQREAQARAEAAGWELRLSSAPHRDGVEVVVAANDHSGETLAGALTLRRVRPSEGGYDIDVPLDADGRAFVPLPRPGRWHLVARAERDGAVIERVYRVER